MAPSKTNRPKDRAYTRATQRVWWRCAPPKTLPQNGYILKTVPPCFGGAKREIFTPEASEQLNNTPCNELLPLEFQAQHISL